MDRSTCIAAPQRALRVGPHQRQPVRWCSMSAMHTVLHMAHGAQVQGGIVPHWHFIVQLHAQRAQPRLNSHSAVSTAVATEAAAPLGSFKIEAAAVQQLLQQRQCSMDALMLSLMQPAAKLARPAISSYHVG